MGRNAGGKSARGTGTRIAGMSAMPGRALAMKWPSAFPAESETANEWPAKDWMRNTLPPSTRYSWARWPEKSSQWTVTGVVRLFRMVSGDFAPPATDGGQVFPDLPATHVKLTGFRALAGGIGAKSSGFGAKPRSSANFDAFSGFCARFVHS